MSAGIGMASTSGLGMFLGDEKNAPLPRAGDLGGISVSGDGGAFTFKKFSACHSYQTWRWLVSLQIFTWSSELLGRYSGTLNGKKSGNQLSMSLEIRSFR
ncbi:unnamed protein product [Mycena citricolor]|uniref:Uncharacterized protein n=1 Tax=Mycena citricolor TaxID=2018698 RepID=A0AAD2H352_9AGAR|nr:unnamed protein product [Mycena citricolor]CAK5269143.1 unnamed protein product [Mycena citricolor]